MSQTEEVQRTSDFLEVFDAMRVLVRSEAIRHVACQHEVRIVIVWRHHSGEVYFGHMRFPSTSVECTATVSGLIQAAEQGYIYNVEGHRPPGNGLWSSRDLDFHLMEMPSRSLSPREYDEAVIERVEERKPYITYVLD